MDAAALLLRRKRGMTRRGLEWLEPLLRGKTAVCIASGPSLTAEDCAAARRSGLPALVTNTTFRLCPWADVLVGFDARWWKQHEEELATWEGRRVTCSTALIGGRVERLALAPSYKNFGNSGTAAASLAIFAGARRVLLIGYDCQLGPGGLRHWHGDHPAGLSNAQSLKAWPRRFEALAAYATLRRCPVVNCSRTTALSCFPRAELEAELEAEAARHEAPLPA
jgi:hypothetical protein